MKVLVIGGTGLISTAIVDQLIARGDDVTVYNRGVTPKRVVGDVRVIKGDRWQHAAFESEMKQHRFDAVIDMVAYAPECTESVARAFAGTGAHLVVCSTVCVYGGPMTKLPATDDEPHRPVTGRQRLLQQPRQRAFQRHTHQVVEPDLGHRGAARHLPS